jgi:putative membrane protein
MMRAALAVSGLVAIAALWFGPLPALAQGSFTAHMALHMGVAAVAAPLLALGIAGGRLDPVGHAPVWFAPIPASMAEFVVVWAWHAPALHHLARHTLWGSVLEQATFLFTGLLLWLSVFGGEQRTGNRDALGLVALLMTSMHMTLLGALLALGSRPLYAHHGGLAMLTPLEDQHVGGVIMLVVGGASYLLGGLYLTARLVRRTASQPA